MELLILLAARNGHLVTRAEIAECLWKREVFVDTEHGINTAVRKIRQALRDDPEQPRFVQTVTGKGYRFIGSIVEVRPSPASEERLSEANGLGLVESSNPLIDDAAAAPAETEQPGASRIAAVRMLRQPVVLVLTTLTIMLAVASAVWLHERAERQRWAREDAVPEITRLIGETKPLAAFKILLQAEQDLRGDSRLAKVAQSFTRFTSVNAGSARAKVEIQDYLAPDSAWYSLGKTPIERARIPDGYFRWRISRPGSGNFVAAPATADSMVFPLEPADVKPGMLPVPGGPWGNMIGFIGWVKYQLPAFDIDRLEVTNREYQKFVDAGAYQKREYWKERFVKDGKELTWEQAMALFRDPTGRPGPSTWEGGHFPQGQSEYPVSGVSWYEASAYAVFADKSLPALGQWYKTASNEMLRYTINQSHFDGRGPMPAGSSQAVGPYGTYDLIGNVREWCLNSVVDEDSRFILGGAWGTQTYQAYEPEALPPFDRSAFNGFRGVRNREPLMATATGPVVRQTRDFSKVKPATNEVFALYKAMYAYDRRPLNSKAEGVVEDTDDWTKEKVTINAGYDGQRLPMYLFLPKNVHPPYQTVVFFPSARVNMMKSSQDLGDLDFINYVIESGRAVLYPIYRETYERRPKNAAWPGTVDDRELTIQESKEVRRAVDYLETQPTIVDMNKLAYLGVSQGSAYGVIFTALEERFKAVVFLDGGFFLNTPVAGRDQADFAPRLKKPVLMVNGKYDFTFPPDQAQTPMFEMIGTPPPNKFRKVLDTPHDVVQRKPELSKEVLGFLDRFLGRVN